MGDWQGTGGGGQEWSSYNQEDWSHSGQVKKLYMNIQLQMLKTKLKSKECGGNEVEIIKGVRAIATI